MKKNLIVALALVFVLGIAGTAFAAANPFVDVPAKHWAYDAVSKLAQAGILDGYGDGTYRGERLATRYEMAQATAKAMARSDKANAQLKALIDKLAVEFAAELNNLGVRVAKLEKYASTIKFVGDSRIRYQKNDDSAAGKLWDIRVRLLMNADLSDKTAFNGVLAAQNRVYADDFTASNNDQLEFTQAYFTFKNVLPNTNFVVGRMTGMLLNGQFMGWDAWDGLKLEYANGKFGFMVGYGDARYAGGPMRNEAAANIVAAYNFAAVGLRYDFSKEFQGTLSYLSTGNNVRGTRTTAIGTTVANADVRSSTIGLGMRYLSGDWMLRGEYLSNGIDTGFGMARTAWNAQLQYKMANRAKVGSWDIYLGYMSVGAQVWEANKLSAMLYKYSYNTQGWELGMNYIIAKNVKLSASYQSLTAINGDLAAGAGSAWQLRSDFWF